MARVRTNIEIESGHLDTVMTRHGVHIRTEAVDLALRGSLARRMILADTSA